MYPFHLSAELARGLKALSQREGATLFMALLAAFQALLARYTGQEEDIVVGTPIANRMRAELEGLIGFFTNTLVLRTDLSGKPRFRELLRRVREVTLGAYTHQDLPFEKLVEELQPERNLSHHPLFQVMFVLQNTPTLGTAPAEDTPQSGDVPIVTGTAKFDLTISLVESEQGLLGAVEYNTDLFEKATIERLVGHYQTLLEGIVADPEQRISELPLLTETERRIGACMSWSRRRWSEAPRQWRSSSRRSSSPTGSSIAKPTS
jgi:non-ribosomal peptide synthetase component F